MLAHVTAAFRWKRACRHSSVASTWCRCSTASQTSWAILGLLAAREFNSRAVERGIAWLAARQNADGSWTEKEWTGTGFPKVFYLRYHLYRAYFPLSALTAWVELHRDHARHPAVQSLTTAAARQAAPVEARRAESTA